MNITDCFQMRKRRSVDKTPGRSHEDGRGTSVSPVGRKLHTPCHPSRTSCNTSFFDQSLDIVWDNNSPSPARTLSLGKRKKHYGSDSSSSGGEISDLVQKLADKSGQTPESNHPMLAFWMSREGNATSQKMNGNGTVSGISATTQKNQEFQTPSRRPRRVLRKCNKSKMRLLKQDIELLCNQVEKTDGENSIQEETGSPRSNISKSDQQKDDAFTVLKQRQTTEPDCNDRVSATVDEQLFDGWDTDEDTVLSQVEIPCFNNNVPETQVLTNTQLLHTASHTLYKNSNVKPKAFDSKDQSMEKQIDENDSIVTESWDFVDDFGNGDDEDILESALDEFEKSQQVSVPDIRRVPLLHVKSELSHSDIKADVCNSIIPVSRLQNSNSGCQVQRLQDTSSTLQRNSYAKCQTTAAKTNFSFIPRSMYENTMNAASRTLVTHSEVRDTRALASSSNKVQRNSNSQGIVNKPQENLSAKQKTAKGGTKPFQYSKEEIERKKIEALNRRKQKMSQSQQNNQNSRI